MSELWLDESRFQSAPNHVAVKAAGVTGVICNDGDPGYAARIQGAYAAGLRVGTYHYLNQFEDPANAARAMLTRMTGTGVPQTIVALDLEEGSGNQSPRALTFLKYLQNNGIALPWLYTGGWFIPGHLEDPRLADFPLWDAAYQTAEPAPPYPWTHIGMWQFTSSGTVAGITGSVDESYLFQSAPQGATVDPATKSAWIRLCVYAILGRQGIDKPSWDAWQAQFATTTDPDVLVAAFTDSPEAVAYRTALHNVAIPTLQPHTHTLSGVTGPPP